MSKKMIMQKKYYAALLLGMSINACAMDKKFLTDADLDARRRLIEMQKLTQEVNDQNRVIPESGGHFTMVGKKGILVIVQQTDSPIKTVYIPNSRL